MSKNIKITKKTGNKTAGTKNSSKSLKNKAEVKPASKSSNVKAVSNTVSAKDKKKVAASPKSASKPAAKKPVAVKSAAKKPVAKVVKAKPAPAKVAAKPVIKAKPAAPAKAAKPAVAKKAPVVAKKPAVVAKKPVGVAKKPAVVAKKPVVVAKKPAVAPAPKSAPVKKAPAKTAQPLKIERRVSTVSVSRTVTKVVEDTSKKATGKNFSKAELKEFYDDMVEMAKRLSIQINEVREQSLLRHDEVNQDEDGTDAFERVISLDRASVDQSTIFEINKALRAIDEGTYGLCEICGGKIEKPRLKALPFVKTCIKCQSAMEGTGENRRIPSMDLWD